MELKATAIISSLMERDLNGIVVEPKRLFSYQRLNRNPMLSIFFCNGALLGQLHVELRYITYWPDNLLTCIVFCTAFSAVTRYVVLIFQKGKK